MRGARCHRPGSASPNRGDTTAAVAYHRLEALFARCGRTRSAPRRGARSALGCRESGRRHAVGAPDTGTRRERTAVRGTEVGPRSPNDHAARDRDGEPCASIERASSRSGSLPGSDGTTPDSCCHRRWTCRVQWSRSWDQAQRVDVGPAARLVKVYRVLPGATAFRGGDQAGVGVGAQPVCFKPRAHHCTVPVWLRRVANLVEVARIAARDLGAGRARAWREGSHDAGRGRATGGPVSSDPPSGRW